jgi:hypothetical protein
MSRSLRVLMRIASLTLPKAHRARWREEALAVLLDVHGARRRRYALDSIIKAPLLAAQLRRAAPLQPPARWAAGVAGAALLSMPILIVGALALSPIIGEDAAEFFFLIAPAGMLPAVAIRSRRSAARGGGGWPEHVVALLVTLFAGTGPIAAGALSAATGTPTIALVGSVLPGAWLIAVCGALLVRGRSPVALAVLGSVAGAALIGVLLGLQLSMLAPSLQPLTMLLSVLSLATLTPTYIAWSLWAGARLLRGRTELLAG